jgi:dihydrofolate synthase/folylpolyglutamate synthase
MIASYHDALAFIYSYIDYERKGPEGFAPSLSRVTDLLAALGNPHTDFSALLIAGTKGKGSTAAMSESVLRAAGYRTGLYISPHLHTFRERIRVGGQMISGPEMAALIRRLQPIVEKIPGITPFEIITALAFTYFARCGVEVAVLEVGLGGRLDATNVVDPAIAVITSISYDHTQLLGDTLALIASEKAGIIKPSATVVSAPQMPEALAIIERVCRENRAGLILVGRDWMWEAKKSDLKGQRFSVRRTARGQYPCLLSDAELSDLWIPLLGRHQLANATTAIAAVCHMERAGFPVSGEAIKEGLARTQWPGRLEILPAPAGQVSRQPLIVLDSAHNGDSALKLREALRDLFPDRGIVLVFGASSDKDIRGMMQILLPEARHIIATQSRHPRSADPQDIKLLARQQGHDVEVQAAVPAALERALELAEEIEGAAEFAGALICVTGSIFIVANAREYWAKRTGNPLPDVDPPI